MSVQVWFCEEYNMIIFFFGKFYACEEYNIMIIYFFEVLCVHFC